MFSCLQKIVIYGLVFYVFFQNKKTTKSYIFFLFFLFLEQKTILKL